jgi:pilus assembly protein CpaE
LASWVPGDFLRILLVSTEEGLRDQVGDALAGRAGEHRLYWISQSDLAPGRAQDLGPHIILLDSDALGSLTGDLVSKLVTVVPDAGLVVLVQSDSMDQARQAVLAGAHAFVAKPIDPDVLIGAMRQVLARRGPVAEVDAGAPIGRVVLFCAPKGGTGRTTLAINTSISLQQVTGQPVVLVDADYAAPAIDVALNLRDGRDISELRPKMSHLDRDLVASVLAKHESGLSVLLAPPPSGMTVPLSRPQVQQVLVWLRRMFPWVIVDLGLPMDETAFAFLDGADLICMSMLPEMIGLRNTRLMFEQLRSRGCPEEKIWLILNRKGLPAGVDQAAIEDWLGRNIHYAIPNDQVLATETVNRGVPMVLGHKRSAVAKACRGLADELWRALPVKSIPVTMGEVEGKATAPAEVAALPPKRRIGLPKPALVGLMGALIVLLLAWRVPPLLRRGQEGQAGASATPTAAILALAKTEVSPSATGATPTPARAAQPGRASAQTGATPGESTPLAGAESLAASRTASVKSSPSLPGESTAVPTETARTPMGLSPEPTLAPSRAATPEPTATAPRKPTATATQEPTATPQPTATSTPEPSATPIPAPTSTRVAPTRRPTRAAPAANPTVGQPGVPSPREPGAGESRGGSVTFAWQPAGSLPAGAAYEVVVWYPSEAPAAARGIAAPTTESSLTVDLNGLSRSGQLQGGDLFWTVLIVQTNPYQRLTQPSANAARLLTFQAPGGGGAGGTPEPPIP